MDKRKWLSGIMGVVVGDALGVPVQFMSRAEAKEKNVTGMVGYMTFNLPEGSWSDDSSMTLATLSSMKARKCIDSEDIMKRFVDWYEDGEYTPYGYSFDIGQTCTQAILRYKNGYDRFQCGCKDENSNGNGSLMRIMPVCLFVYESVKHGTLAEEEGLNLIHEISALTHAHLRSQMACGFYYFLVKAILDEKGSLTERLQKGVDEAADFYYRDLANIFQVAYFERLFQLDEFADTAEEDIESSGYVIDSIEAAVWSLITTDSYESALLKVINLGEDTDTIGAIAGGLAGLYYGYDNIPKEWRDCIVKKEWIENLCDFQ